ncbi:MAG: cbb3-type cytochrome oxidase assembly protein CcoS [Bacteroidota bacterium]
MTAIFLLIGFSLLLAGGFLFAFFWAVKDGQYEDDFTPAVRILYDKSERNDSTQQGNP